MLSFQNQVNAIGGFAFLIAGGYFVSEFTRSRETPPCSTRFPAATQMSFQKTDGAPMTPAEFQARVGMGEHGVIEKTAVRRTGGAYPLVLDVKIGGPGSGDFGAGFFWTPSGLQAPSSACLAYNVQVPQDFDYATGGMLPGLYGANPSAAAGAQAGFAGRVMWSNSGAFGVETNLSDFNMAQSGQPLLHRSVAVLPRGRWVSVEQEIVLNSPNAKDGLLKLWVDGRLVIDISDIAWRGASFALTGVLADVGYLASHEASDKKATALTLSPLQLSWQ